MLEEVVSSMKIKRQNLEMKLPPKITIADHFKDLEEKSLSEQKDIN
jgi:hypothetical protein